MKQIKGLKSSLVPGALRRWICAASDTGRRVPVLPTHRSRTAQRSTGAGRSGPAGPSAARQHRPAGTGGGCSQSPAGGGPV